MSVNINTPYPPIVNSSISAFVYNTDQINVNFTLPITMNVNIIKHIDIQVALQSNNKKVVNTKLHYGSIIYRKFNTENTNGIYTVSINKDDIKMDNSNENGWQPGVYYKIQIRFGYGELPDYSGVSEESDKNTIFNKWLREQKNLNNFSEWSNVIITKAINQPKIEILNNALEDSFYPNTFTNNSDNVENSRFPKFQGGYSNKDEPLDKYRFRLYKGRYSDKDYETYQEPYLTSDWIQINSSEGNNNYESLVEYTFNQPLNILLNPKYYTVILDTISKNQYYASSEEYVFTVSEGVLNKLNNLTLVVKDNSNSGYYGKRFTGASKNVFTAYKKLFGLPIDSVYLKSVGSDIYYLNSSKPVVYHKELNENNLINIDSIDIKNLGLSLNIIEKKENKLYLFLQYYDKDNNIQQLFKTLNYEEDYEVNKNDIDELNKIVLKIKLKEKIYNVIGGDIYFVQTKDIKVLTLDERLKQVSLFEQNPRCDENGTLEIYLKNNTYQIETEKFDDVNGFSNYELVDKYQSLDGTYYLIRSDEKSNFTIWEDLAKFEFYNDQQFDNKLKMLYEDFTVESGINYKYAIQKESVLGYRSPPKFEFNELELSPSHCSNFQYTYIYAHGVQVRLDMDVKIQQFKHTRLFQKQDSLNSKYPIILRNGLANYAEFSLGGKITLHSDVDNSFLLKEPSKYDVTTNTWTGGYKLNNNTNVTVISPDKYMDIMSREQYLFAPNNQIINSQDLFGQDLDYEKNDYNLSSVSGVDIDSFIYDSNGVLIYPKLFLKIYKDDEYSLFNTNPTNNNIFMERIYRKYVEEFLNDGDYKLYKSPTEGNMIVTLVNVSLTPNQQLNRLISDFTSTVYEVAENNVSNIKLYDINPLDVITNNMYLSLDTRFKRNRTVAGQVRGVFDGKYHKCLSISGQLYKILKENKFPVDDYFIKDSSNKAELELKNYQNNLLNTTQQLSSINDEVKELISVSLDEYMSIEDNKWNDIITNYIEENKRELAEKNISYSEIVILPSFLGCYHTYERPPQDMLNFIYNWEIEQWINNILINKKEENYSMPQISYKERQLVLENKKTLIENELNYMLQLWLDKKTDELKQSFEKSLLINSMTWTEFVKYLEEDANNFIINQINSFKRSLQANIDLLDKAEKIENNLLLQNKQEKTNSSNLVDFRNYDNNNWNEQYDDIVDWIRLQEERIISDEKKYQLEKIKTITVELYPKHDIEQEILNLKANTYDTKVNKLSKELLLAQYELILKQYDISQSNPITLILNGEKEITLLPNRTYHLEDVDVKSLHLKYTRPVLINYTAEVVENDDIQNVTLGKKEMVSVGQVSGVFTDSENILRNYIPEDLIQQYLNASNAEDKKILQEKINQFTSTYNKNLILFENEELKYNLYRSLNILDIIREQVKSKIYNITNENNNISSFNYLEQLIDTFLKEKYTSNEEKIQVAKMIMSQYKHLLNINKDKNTDIWQNKGRYIIYKFEGLELLDIEADANTEVKFNTRDYYQPMGGIVLEDDGNESRVIVGKTNRFTLSINEDDVINELEYINDCRFSQPTYAIINYRAIVSLETKGAL